MGKAADQGDIGLLYGAEVSSQREVSRMLPTRPDTPHPGNFSYRWFHFDLTVAETRQTIEAMTDRVISDALTQTDTRPRCLRYGDGFLLNLRGVNTNPGSDPEDMVSIRMWVQKDLIVSARLRRLMAVVDLRDTFDTGKPPPTVGAFLTKLIHGLTERMDPVIKDLAEQVDDLEAAAIDDLGSLRSTLAEQRRSTIILRRYIAPQRDAIAWLVSDNAREGDSLFSEKERSQIRETADRITRMVEELEAIRDRSAILYDQVSDRRAEEMNRNTLILSIVAAIFLPLGFLTGLLGVNIGGIPGASVPWAFAAFCVILVGLGVALLGVFRKLKWI